MHIKVVCPHCLEVNHVEKKASYITEQCQSCEASLMENNPLNANMAILEYFLQHSTLPVIVDFWAPWCGPCLTMAPHFEAAAMSMPLRAQFLKINNDMVQIQNPNIIITNIPAVLLFKEGKEIGRFTGLRSSRQIIKWVEKYLGF